MENKIEMDMHGQFLAHKAEIDLMLERLAKLSANHFNVNPDEMNWMDVSNINYFRHQLQELVDRAFKEGEFAD